MDTQRLVLIIAFLSSSLLLWEAWQRDYHQPLQPLTTNTILNDTQIPFDDNSVQDQPDDLPSNLPTNTLNEQPTPLIQPAEIYSEAQSIHVETDLLTLEISTTGGDIRQAKLLHYPEATQTPEIPFQLLQDTGPNLFIAQSGLVSKDKLSSPNHYANYRVEQTDYRLQPGQDKITVSLYWKNEQGVTVEKRFSFYRDSYRIDIDYLVNNQSATPWDGRVYNQFQRRRQDTRENTFIYTYTGGTLYSDAEKYEKIDFGDMDDEALSRNINGGWTAMIQHYFLAAWLPDQKQDNHYYSKALGNGRYSLGYSAPGIQIAPNSEGLLSTQLYIGPKEQARLEEILPSLKLTVDYGILTVIAQPLFWLLDVLHDLTSNWGWAIILVTLLIKLVFFKLSEASYRSMAHMRRIHPRLQALKERHGDDRQKMNQAMMELYKTEKINPLGGCLPMLIQIPVFIALYWVLLESVEMRQAPFILWLQDLSAKDPYYILPLIMGVSMFIQQKLNPTPIDPIQQKVMMVLPFIFTVFFAFFPAGLVLYWVVNNILSITQQWYITKKIEQQG